jgi:hypothetical protein
MKTDNLWIGHCFFNGSENYIAIYDAWKERYWIDLDRCQTKSEVLDWLFHINNKTWATADIMKDLLSMFSMVLPDEVKWDY